MRAQCQQIRTLTQIEFTINLPGAATESQGKKKKRSSSTGGKKAKKMKMEILAL